MKKFGIVLTTQDYKSIKFALLYSWDKFKYKVDSPECSDNLRNAIYHISLLLKQQFKHHITLEGEILDQYKNEEE